MLDRIEPQIAFAPMDETGSDAPEATVDVSPEAVLYENNGSRDEPSQDNDVDASGNDADDDVEATQDANSVPDDGKYEFNLPDGVPLDKELAELAGPQMRDAGITQKQANTLAGILGDQRRQQAEAWNKTQEDWISNAKADREIGGGGFDRSIDTARKALERFGTPELRDYLTHSGGGNHPELIRFMARVGNAFSEDKPVGSSTSATVDTKDHAQILYPGNRT